MHKQGCQQIDKQPHEMRHLRGDLETYKIINGLEGIEATELFEFDKHAQGTRGHRMKLVQQQSRLEARKNFFSQRVVKEWNSLP